MVKHAADEHKPLYTAAERVALAFEQVTAGHTFTPDQQQWLDRIRSHMIQNLSIDPEDFDTMPILANAGDKLFLQDPQLGTQSWQPLRTWSDSSSNQGLRYYKDTIWYRTNLTVPEKFAGRKMRVWMGGVDDTARVWIDGHELELLQKGSAPIGMPWEFDAGATLTPGKQQVIVVKVSDNSMNELGTMGITGPVMIWAEP
mgnify:CR=1 FL=1